MDGLTSIHEFLPQLMSQLTSTTTSSSSSSSPPGRLIDFGAGVRDDDPMFPFVDAKWEALLVDGDPDQRLKMEKRFPYDTAHVDISYILADTMTDLLHRHDGFDSLVDMLKIDIDSFDCYVMHKILQVIRPKVVIMEVNVKYPPHMRMALFPGYEYHYETSSADAGETKNDNKNKTALTQIPFNSEQRGHVYGCSLAYQVQDLMKPNGYELIHMDWNNAIYIDTMSVVINNGGLNNDATTTKTTNTRGKKSSSWQDMYNNGYWNRKDRDTEFGFNREIIPWNTKTVDQVYEALQELFQSGDDSSHANHHLYFADVEEEDLVHACFDSKGVLEHASKSKGCTPQIVKDGGNGF